MTLPLEMLLGARVYRRPRHVARALWPPVVAFLVWDIVAIGRGTWWFNSRYVTGWELPFGVPLEEVLFFLVIPLCALLTYETIRGLLGARDG